MNMCKHDVTQDCPACAEETIASLKEQAAWWEEQSRQQAVRIEELESNERAYEEIIGKMTYREVADRIKELEGALRLAEDVLSRAPFSTGIWPNGMHPNAGIEKIRAALEPKP